MTTSPARHPEPEPPERTERAGTVAARRAPESPAGRVLELQRSVGNRAVAALVARDPKPGAAPAKERHYEVKFADIGTIEVLSWSWGESGRGRHGSGGTGRVTINELNFSSELGPHSAALMNATASGTPLGTVVLEAFNEGKVAIRIKIHEAMISSYQVAGHASGDRAHPLEQWTLTGSKIEFEYTEAPKTADKPAAPPG